MFCLRLKQGPLEQVQCIRISKKSLIINSNASWIDLFQWILNKIRFIKNNFTPVRKCFIFFILYGSLHNLLSFLIITELTHKILSESNLKVNILKNDWKGDLFILSITSLFISNFFDYFLFIDKIYESTL